MDKMKLLAKTLIAITAIYWLLKVCTSALRTICYTLFINMSKEGTHTKDIFAIITTILSLLGIVVVLVVILLKRDKISAKILGQCQEPLPEAQINWVSFSFRLVSIIAGLYFLGKTIQYIEQIIFFLTMRPNWPQTLSGFGDYHQILCECVGLFFFMVIGIYLLCGAPHFVRWQTKKTMEMLRQ